MAPRLTLGRLALAGLTALGVAAAPRLVRQARAVRAVDPGLRGPLVLLPLPMSRLGAVSRLAPRGEPADAEGVRAAWRSIPPTEGRPGVDAVVYEPVGRRRPHGALLWLHGGGYVLGSPLQDDAWCARVCRQLGVTVVAPAYRLAPEHPFPAAHDDAHAALAWLHDQADALGVDAARVAVGGDSAGGGLAAGLVQRAHDEGVGVAFQLLAYPMLDDRTVPRAEREKRWAVVWTPADNRRGWTAFLGHEPGVAEPRPYAAPARRVDLAGLPPTWLGVGDVDLFHDEDVAYAGRLAEAGVEVDLHVVPGMPHAADRGSEHPTMLDFRRRMLAALGRHLTG